MAPNTQWVYAWGTVLGANRFSTPYAGVEPLLPQLASGALLVDPLLDVAHHTHFRVCALALVVGPGPACHRGERGFVARLLKIEAFDLVLFVYFM